MSLMKAHQVSFETTSFAPSDCSESLTATSSGSERESFGRSGPRTLGRDLRFLDAGAGQNRVERVGELPSPVADHEPEAGDVTTVVHQKIRIYCVAHSPSVWSWALSFPLGVLTRSVLQRLCCTA